MQQQFMIPLLILITICHSQYAVPDQSGTLITGLFTDDHVIVGTESEANTGWYIEHLTKQDKTYTYRTIPSDTKVNSSGVIYYGYLYEDLLNPDQSGKKFLFTRYFRCAQSALSITVQYWTAVCGGYKEEKESTLLFVDYNTGEDYKWKLGYDEDGFNPYTNTNEAGYELDDSALRSQCRFWEGSGERFWSQRHGAVFIPPEDNNGEYKWPANRNFKTYIQVEADNGQYDDHLLVYDITVECEIEPTPSPTNAPSLAPSEAPSMGLTTPTQSPVFTDTTLYVRQAGCDFGVCSHSSTDYNDSACDPSGTVQLNYPNQAAECCARRRRLVMQNDFSVQYLSKHNGALDHGNRRRLLTTAEPTNEPTFEPTFYPSLEPTLDPTDAPSQPPSMAPSQAPSVAPSQPPSMAPTIKPTESPTNSTVDPTDAPTGAPSIAPSVSPTQTPIDTPVYQPTCSTVDYAYQCLQGTEWGGIPDADSCAGFNYTGSGTINLGDGIFDIATRINLDTADITFQGNGRDKTVLNFIGSATPSGWFGCRWHKCYIKMVDLSIASDKVSGVAANNWVQLVMTKGGSMQFDNVLFDGAFVAVNSGTSFWDISGAQSQLIVRDSVFKHNDVSYRFDGVVVRFIGCIFERNSLSTNDVTLPMFYAINGASVEFDGCTFSGNTNSGRSLIGIYSRSSLRINNCTFVNNTGSGSSNDHIIFIQSSGTSSEINITNSIFDGTEAYNDIIYVSDSSVTTVDININNTVFQGGASNKYEIVGDIAANLRLTNTQFFNGAVTSYSLWLKDTNNVFIEDVIWENYTTANGHIIDKSNSGETTVYIDNIDMSNIIGRGVYISAATQTIYISNSRFYNIDAADNNGACLYLGGSDIVFEVENTDMVQCHTNTIGGGIYVNRPGVNSRFENLTFIDNSAGDYSADCYILNTERADGEIIIGGKWEISGSSSANIPSSTKFDNQHSDENVLWTINMNDWSIRDTKNNIAVYFNGIDFNIDNLQAINNANGVLYVSNDDVNARVVQHSITNSNFEQNGGAVSCVGYNGAIPLPQTSAVTMAGNIFDDNNGGILQLTVTDESVAAIPIKITDSRVVNHTDVSSALFQILTDVACTAGTGNNWAKDDQLLFKDVVFVDNINVPLVDIQCVEVNMDNITLTRNEMSVLRFGDYTRPNLTRFDASDNKGQLIQFNSTYYVQMIAHTVANHVGTYLYYDATNTINGNEEMMISDCSFTGGNSYYLGSDYALVYIAGKISRISGIELLFDTVTFDANTGRLIFVDNSDTNGVDLSTCIDVADDYTAGQIEFKSCTFANNLAAVSGVDLLEFHWSKIEMDSTNSFSNNNVNNMILSVDCALSIDGVILSNNNIRSLVKYERLDDIGSNSASLCVANLDINIMNTSYAVFEFAELANDDNIIISDIIVSSVHLNSFIAGYAASDQYTSHIRLQSLSVAAFAGNGIFIDLSNANNNIFNIDLEDSTFNNTNGDYSVILVNSTSTDGVTKVLNINNVTFSDITTPINMNLFSVISTGNTPIDLDVDYLSFSVVNTNYYFYIEGGVVLNIGPHLSFDSIDNLVGAQDALGIYAANSAFSDFNSLFEIFIEDPMSLFDMNITNMDFINGVNVLSVDLAAGISINKASILFKGSYYNGLTLTNEEDHIFAVHSDGLALDFTFDGGDFINILANNNISSCISLTGGINVVVDISDSVFINVSAIRIDRTNTDQWAISSLIDIHSCVFLSSWDSNMVFVTKLSVNDELSISHCNFTKSGVDISLLNNVINDNDLATELVAIGTDKVSVTVDNCLFDQMVTFPVYTIDDLATDNMAADNNTYNIIRPNMKFSNNKYFNHNINGSVLVDIQVYDSNNNVFDIPRIQFENDEFSANNISACIAISFQETQINFALARNLTGTVLLSDTNFINNDATAMVSVSGFTQNNIFIFDSLFESNTVDNIMSVVGFGDANFTNSRFISNDVSQTLLPFTLDSTEISFTSCDFNNNTVRLCVLAFNGRGTVIILDTEFNYNTADILISAIGVHYDVTSLTLFSDGATMESNKINQSVFEMGNANTQMNDMTLAGNTLLIRIVYVIDLDIQSSSITDMSGIDYGAAANISDGSSFSVITVTDTNFTNSLILSTVYYAIQAYIAPNDQIRILNCTITALPVTIYPQTLPALTNNDANIVQILFDSANFLHMSGDNAFYFDNLGKGWYPNVTFINSKFSNSEININEMGNISQPAFASSITLQDCIFSDINGIVIQHTFLVAPITSIGLVSAVLKDAVFAYPFLKTQLSDSTTYPCELLPSFTTHSLYSSQFSGNTLSNSLFELECSSLLIERSSFHSNTGNGNEIGLFDISGGNDLYIADSVFNDNGFDYYGLIFDYGGIVQYELNAIIDINNCTFQRNTALRGSVLTVDYNANETIYYGSELVLFSNCTFIANTANDRGGIIYVNVKDTNYTKEIRIVESDVINNTATNLGGAIYAKDLSISITSCVIKGNSAQIAGGAMAVMSDKCDSRSNTLAITGSTRISGHHSSQIGGAIIIGCAELMIGAASNDTDTNVFIDDNTAMSRGGAIHAHHSCISAHENAEIYLTDNTANYGAALSFGAGVADGNTYCDSTLDAYFISFENNIARKHGAAVHVSYAPYTIYENISTVLSSLPAELSYYDETWELSDYTALIIANADFKRTTAEQYGSAVTVEYELFNESRVIEEWSAGLSVSVTIENSIFQNNYIDGKYMFGGAAITYFAHHNESVSNELVVNNCDFIGNKASTSKYGVIWLDLDICVGDLLSYDAENCTCYERYEDDINVNFDIINSTFSKSKAKFGGAIFSKMPSKIRNNTFEDDNAMEGGAVYVGCARDVEIISCTFANIHCLTHGGAAYFNSIKHSLITSSVFKQCDAPFGGGAVAFNLHPVSNSNISIGDGTIFSNNKASFGSAILLSAHKIMTITDPVTVAIGGNSSSIVTIRLSTLNVTQFTTPYIFIVLVPSDNSTADQLEWKSAYEWTDDDLPLVNDKERFKKSKVADSRFMSPLFVPLKLKNTNDEWTEWTISNKDGWGHWSMDLNFSNFMDALSNPPLTTQMSFDVFLAAYKFIAADDTNSGKSFTMRMNGVIFDSNNANALSTVYINEDSYRDVDISMIDVNFTRNMAPTLTGFTVDRYGPIDGFEDGDRQIQCVGCNFANNFAFSSATCLNVLAGGSDLSCSDCVFSSNIARCVGAVVYSVDGSLDLTGCTINDNHSPAGGNIFVDASSLFMRDSAFNRNTAVHNGGSAVTISNFHKLVVNKLNTTRYDDLIEINGCSFRNHSGKTAGTIYLPITDSLYSSIASRRLSNAANINNGRRLLHTDTNNGRILLQTAARDIVHIDTDLLNIVSCDGLEVIFYPDFHAEDISFTLQFDEDSNDTVSINSTYGCISNIPFTVDCITVTVLDYYGDGLNYGDPDGIYTVSWNGTEWDSPSLGNYGASESLTICPKQYTETATLTVFVEIESADSLQFLEFLDDDLMALFDDTISYNVVFNIEDESIADNATCVDCQYGYCVCDVSVNITMQNIIAALCYSTRRDVYNYTWEEFWADDIDFDDTSIDDLCLSGVETLLDSNYATLQTFTASGSFPAFYIDSQSTDIIDVTSYLSAMSMSTMSSDCDLHNILYDIIHPICASLETNGVSPLLCQANPSNCYTSYCNTTSALLSIVGDTSNGYQSLHYEPYSFDGIVGSPLLNIKHTKSNVYGIEEYEDQATLGCFSATQLFNIDLIKNTIPVLAVNLDACDYIDVITKFQEYGARAVVLVTDIYETRRHTTPSPTRGNRGEAFNYDHWLPFDCLLTFNSQFANYSAQFQADKSQIDAQMANVFETNIRANNTDTAPYSVHYAFEANTTYDKLSVPDKLVSNYLANYMEFQLNLWIDLVQCEHRNEINESFSNAPTPQPTNQPTLSPTDRNSTYDAIYIPIELVTLSDAVSLTQVASDYDGQLSIAFLCDTNAPTAAPTHAPTVSPSSAPIGESEEDITDEFVIFAFDRNNATRLSMGVSFPDLPIDHFINVYQHLCGFPPDELGSVFSKEYVSFVTVDTVFNAFNSICVELNDDSNTMITGWSRADDVASMLWTSTTATPPTDTGNGCASTLLDFGVFRTNIGRQQRGTYCIAIYTNKAQSGKQYNLRIKQLFEWTPPFVTITNSYFINNAISQGKGGAITIETDENVYEFVSISITNTIFDMNYAVGGGGAIYRGMAQTGYSSDSIQMSILQMTNIQMYHNIAQNTKGGSIMTELLWSQNDGLIFRNAISITNMTLHTTTTAGTFDLTMNNNTNQTFGTPSDGFGGGIYLHGTNIYIGNSDIAHGYAWDGGCIWLKDTALTLHNTQVRQCTASHDGGGMKATESTTFPQYDLCLSMYYTNLLQNSAEYDGGGAFVRLHGSGVDAAAESRQSCVKVFDVNFVNNSVEEGEGPSVYLYVTDGHHKILEGDAPFSVVCEGQECVTAGSTLNNFCASMIVAECKKYSNLPTGNPDYETCGEDCSIVNYIPDVEVGDIPGASVTFYVFGWDAFENPLNTTEYNIYVIADKATVITPEGTPSANGEYYLVPLVISIGKKNALGTIVLEDQNGVAETINIVLRVKECDPGYYQHPNEIDPNLFSCELCDSDKYTLKTDKCRTCEQGLFCYGGNEIKVDQNWYAKQGESAFDGNYSNVTSNVTRRRLQTDDDTVFEDPGSYVNTALCPPGYCCNVPEGCLFNDTATLCAPNRDPKVVLCGACKEGYSETLSATGVCSACEESHEWLVVFVFFGGLAAIYFFYWTGHNERSVPHPFMTYMSKTLLFFFQVISFLTFRSSSQLLRPLAELANLNVDMSEDGTCLFKGVSSRGKLWLNLLVPGILSFDMALFYIFVRIRTKRMKFDQAESEEEAEKLRKQWLEIEWIAIKSAMWSMFLIVYVQVTTSFIKLSLCFRFGDRWHMWYAGEITCFDAGHVISLFISFILVFCVPYLMLRVMTWIRNVSENHDKILASLTLSYREQCWYYAAFNIFRRAILIVLPLIPTNDLSIRASFITFTVGLLLAVHCYLMPFKWSANNHLETFILIVSFFIATLNIVDDPPDWFPVLTAVLALSPFLPCIVLFHDFAKGHIHSVAKKVPEMSFIWENRDELASLRLKDASSQNDSPVEPAKGGRTDTVNTAPPDDGEGGIQMTGTAQPQLLTVKKEADIGGFDTIGRTATSNFAVKMDDEEDDEEEEEEEKDGGDNILHETGMIQQSDLHIEDNLWKTVTFRDRTLKIYSRKKTHPDDDEEEEEEDEEDDEYDALQFANFASTKSMRKRRRLSMFERETVRNTKFGAERAWLRGTAPNWLVRWIWKEKHTPIKDMLVSGDMAATVPLHAYEEDEEEEQGHRLEIDQFVLEIEKFPTETFGAMDDNIDCYPDDITIETDKSWIETGGVLLPPIDERMDSNWNRRHSGLGAVPLTLFEIQTSQAEESDDSDRGQDFLSRSNTLKRVSRKKLKRHIDTTYNIIKVEQIAWKLPAKAEKNEAEVENSQDAKAENSQENEEENSQGNEEEAPAEDVIAALLDIDLYIEYVVPDEYKYVDGLFSPKIFDETFKSMVYAHNKNVNLEMRVLQHDKSESDGISVKATWIIIDVEKKSVMYQSEDGKDLYKPPDSGWKRLIDDNEYHSANNQDLNMEILEKEIKYGSIPAPEIIELTHNSSKAVLIEYDYKKLEITDVPHLQQWIEIAAHNMTDPRSADMFKVIYIKKETDELEEVDEKKEEVEEEKKEEDDGLTASQRAYNIFAHNAELLETKRGIKLKKIDWIRTKFEFDELRLEQDYKFTIKLSNCITFAESNLSATIMPMTLPSVGIISNVHCDAYNRLLYINYAVNAADYENKSMNPSTFTIVITPWPGTNAFLSDENSNNNANSYVFDDDSNKIIIAHEGKLSHDAKFYEFEQLIMSNVVFGQEYDIRFEAQNEIGSTVSAPCNYCPVCVPPKPIIESVETDDKNWEMTINVSCAGYEKNDCRGWFEIELIDPEIKEEFGDVTDSNIAATNVNLLNIDEDGHFVDPNQIIDEQKSNDFESTLDSRIQQILKSKHYSSPIVLSPIFAGQTYIIKVKCVNICAFTESLQYHPIFVKTTPPKPTFVSSAAFDGSVVIAYKCANYSYYARGGYAPIFETKATPYHKQIAFTKSNQQRVDGFRNGWDYSFKVRARNKLGVSEYSNTIKLRPLKKPQIPTDLTLVCGPKAITVLWSSSDTMEEPNINGRFVIVSDPQTLEKKIRDKNKIEFQALDNDKYYRFQVIALNDNFRIESEWTQQVKPNAKKAKSEYNQQRADAEYALDKIRRRKLLEEKKKLRVKSGSISTGTGKGKGSPRRQSGKNTPKFTPQAYYE